MVQLLRCSEVVQLVHPMSTNFRMVDSQTKLLLLNYPTIGKRNRLTLLDLTNLLTRTAEQVQEVLSLHNLRFQFIRNDSVLQVPALIAPQLPLFDLAIFHTRPRLLHRPLTPVVSLPLQLYRVSLALELPPPQLSHLFSPTLSPSESRFTSAKIPLSSSFSTQFFTSNWSTKFSRRFECVEEIVLESKQVR